MVFGFLRKPQLRQWNPHFGKPAFRIGRDFGVPDSVPGAIGIVVVRNGFIYFYTGGRHRKGEGRLFIFITVDLNSDPVTVEFIAPRQSAHNAVGTGILCTDQNIDVVVVIQDFKRSLSGGLFPFKGFALQKTASRVNTAPGRIIPQAVDNRRLAFKPPADVCFLLTVSIKNKKCREEDYPKTSFHIGTIFYKTLSSLFCYSFFIILPSPSTS